jgi:tetratricopeptide (TPR) repeat protein
MTPSARARWALPFVLAAATAVTLAPARRAHAQGAPQSQADALFAEGRDLLEKGRYAEACAKLAKSEELAPAVGTLLNLAYCWEQAGKLRSAMDAYLQAEAFAGAAGETKRAAFAKDRYAAVEPRAIKLVVRVAPPETPGLEVKRNGVVIPKTELDRPTAVDPEDYVITATAAGRMPWRGAVIVKGEGSVVTVIVPPLVEQPKLVAAATAPSENKLGSRRLAALGLGAVSALAIGGGVALAFGAKSRYDDAGAHCDDAGCDETGNAIQHGAAVQGNIATALIGLGLLAAGSGIYLWIIGAPEDEKKTSLRFETHPLGAALGGRF